MNEITELLSGHLPTAQFGSMPGGGGYGGWNMMSGSFGGFTMIVLLIVAILVVYLLVRGKNGNTDTPVDILKKRYARGELSKEEYERLRKDIED
ncbi:MAG: SHOCT domain-containing protein [Desulfovibrio sp.]